MKISLLIIWCVLCRLAVLVDLLPLVDGSVAVWPSGRSSVSTQNQTLRPNQLQTDPKCETNDWDSQFSTVLFYDRLSITTTSSSTQDEKHSSQRQLFISFRTRTTITDILLFIFLLKGQNQQASDAPHRVEEEKSKSHEEKCRNVPAGWHHQLVTWPLGWAADAGSWCGRIAARQQQQQPARPADAAPAESRHADAAQQHHHQVRTTPGTAASPSNISRASQFVLLVWFFCRIHSNGRNTPNLSGLNVLKPSVRFSQDLTVSPRVKKSSLRDKCNQRRGN